jgi:hypothetical protein
MEKFKKEYPSAYRFWLYLRGIKLNKKDSLELDKLCYLESLKGDWD